MLRMLAAVALMVVLVATTPAPATAECVQTGPSKICSSANSSDPNPQGEIKGQLHENQLP